MKNILKNVLTIGIPLLVIIAIIITVVKVMKGEGGLPKSDCPGNLQRYDGGECLQCDPTDQDCWCTDDSDCGGKGVCYKNETPDGKHGICKCSDGWGGINCKTFCTGDDDCNGGTCNKGTCDCPTGMAPPDCKNPAKEATCEESPNCNAILINQLKCNKVDTNFSSMEILYYADKQFDRGDKITLLGFPTTGVWANLNSPDGFTGYTVTTGSSCKSPGCENDQYQCWYHCPQGGNDPGCEKGTGPLYPPEKSVLPGVMFPGEKQCTTDGTPYQHDTCFPSGCPVYNTVVIEVPTALMVKAGVSTSGGVYNYSSWDTSATINFKDDTATCYNNSKMAEVDGIGYCTECEDGWGPGLEGINEYTKNSGRTNPPPLGICGRKKNLYRVRLALNDRGHGNSADCAAAYGAYSCAANNNCSQDCGGSACHTDGCGNGHPYRTACMVDGFWANPGTQCQTGAWNGCGQCSSCHGKHDQDNFASITACGAIPDYSLDPTKFTCNPNESSVETDDFGSGCETPSNLVFPEKSGWGGAKWGESSMYGGVDRW